MAIPLGPELKAQATGRLFDAVYREESNGRFEHNYDAAVLQCAQNLMFRYVSSTGADLARSRTNKVFKPRLRSLGQGKSWLDFTLKTIGGSHEDRL
jgi:hypothetical protein